MPTFTEVLPARKSSKKSAIRFTPVESDVGPIAGTLVIDTDRASAAYVVSEFPTSWRGRGFHLAKLTEGTDAEAESYSVFCSPAGPAADTCECKGSLRWNTCKHRDALRSCLENGWL